jgi:quinol monooxygenase YgiN
VIHAVVTIVAAPNKRDEMLKSLRSIIGPTRVEPGCLECHVVIDAIEPERLTLIQTWSTQTDLSRHVRSDRYRMVLAIMESSAESPEVVFDTISKREGLEAVERLRQRNA